MAKYRLRATRFIDGCYLDLPEGQLYRAEPGQKEETLPVVLLPDDMPAGRDMEPLDEAAERQVAAYKAMMARKAATPNPLDALSMFKTMWQQSSPGVPTSPILVDPLMPSPPAKQSPRVAGSHG